METFSPSIPPTTETTSKLSLSEYFNDGKTAFVFGSTGTYARTELFKCMSAIESLITIGGWGGDIYLLIDDTSCLDSKIIHSWNNQNIHIIPISRAHSRKLGNDTSTFEHRNSTTIRRRNLLNTQPFERSMSIKMNILSHLQPSVQYALWYDCDVIFAKQNCVKEMFKQPLDNIITKEKPIAIPFEFHVGSFAVKQGVSNAALHAWSETLLHDNSPSALGDKPSTPDYQVFKKLFAENQSYGLMPEAWHDKIITSQLAPNGSLYWNSTVCAIHLTNGRCRFYGGDAVQTLVQSFGLTSLARNRWCPSLLRRKFKSYGLKLPFCWTPPNF